MPLKTVALVAAVCLTTGWLLASVLMPPTAKLQALPDRRTPQSTASEEMPPAYSEQLRLRLDQWPPAPTPRRNPFVFGARERVVTPDQRSGARGEPATAVLLPPEPIAPTGPIFALSGMAVTQTPSGVIRTAVLSDGQTVHLVKVGETIAGYKVIIITDDSVTLADSSGSQNVLKLR